MIPSLTAINDRVARNLYVKHLAERIELDERTIWSKLKERGKGGAAHAGHPASDTRGGLDGEHLPKAGNRFERQIISMMLQFPDIRVDVESQQVLAHFDSSPLKSIGETILRQQPASAAELLSRIENDRDRDLAASLAMTEESWTLQGCRRLLAQFVNLHVDRTALVDIENQIKAAEKNNDHAEVMHLLNKKQKIVLQQKQQKLKLLRDEKIEK
jgi:DNA primase